MIAMLRSQSHAGPVVQPQAAAFGLPLRNLQPLASPDPLDPLVVDDPARCGPQKLRNLAIAVTAVLTRKFDDVGSKPLLVVASLGCLALCRAMLAERRTGTALGDLECAPDMLNNGTPARGA